MQEGCQCGSESRGPLRRYISWHTRSLEKRNCWLALKCYCPRCLHVGQQSRPLVTRQQPQHFHAKVASERQLSSFSLPRGSSQFVAVVHFPQHNFIVTKLLPSLLTRHPFCGQRCGHLNLPSVSSRRKWNNRLLSLETLRTNTHTTLTYSHLPISHANLTSWRLEPVHQFLTETNYSV